MAFDQYLADRIRNLLKEKGVAFSEKKMMGGLCFMVDDKMCVGIDQDKTNGRHRLMARVGEAASENALLQEGCKPFDITGKVMKGFVLVDEEAIDQEAALAYWVQLSLDFNPLAQRSKSKNL